MKKILALLLALCMVFALAACGEPASDPTDAPDGGDSVVTDAPEGGDSTGDKVIKIGVFEPQSGDNGAGGKQEILGMQYANSLTPTVEVGGETYTVELVYADNQSSNDKAVSAAQTLIAEGCSVVLGSYGSGVSIAAATTFGDAGVPAIGVTCTNPQVTQVSDTYYRICFIDPFQGTVLANYAKELGATKAYCLAKQGDDYSVGLVNYFVEAFGAENCVQEVFQEGTSDYSSYVTNAKSNGCDIFVAPVSTEAAALIIDQAATQDLGMPILAGDTWDSNVIVNAAQGKNVKIYVTTFYQEGGNAEFDAAFKEWINSDSVNLENNGGNDMVAAVSVMGYDAYYVALEAIKAAGSADPAAVLEALPSVSYAGVTGNIAFAEGAKDATRDVAFIKYCNTETGVWDLIGEQGIE